MKNCYDLRVTVKRIDINKLTEIVEMMDKHPRIKRSLSMKDIYMHIYDVTEISEHFDDEINVRIGISVGDIECDCFNVGYYSFSKNITTIEIENQMYEDSYFLYTCKRMINNYVQSRLMMPVPFEDIKKTTYISTSEEHVPITYIDEKMCHSIIKKLFNYVCMSDNIGKTWDDLTKATKLTNDEFYAIMADN